VTTWSAGRYEAVAQFIAPIAAEVIASVAPGPGTALVDLACGTGNAALAGAASGARVTGVDLTAELLAIAAAKPGGAGVTWVRADAAATGLPDAGFDAAVSNMGIIFVEPVAMVAELSRLIKPDGVLGFSTWMRAADNPFFTPIAAVLGMPAPAAYSPDQWGEPDIVHARLNAHFHVVAFERRMFAWQFESLQSAVRFITDESPMHVTVLSGLDGPTRGRLVEAFTAALAAHERGDGSVTFGAPYAMITATRR
jgi:ubiquinone/menaquinone biosynthesis C-methylase UbiE